jgi:hypothetical protein
VSGAEGTAEPGDLSAQPFGARASSPDAPVESNPTTAERPKYTGETVRIEVAGGRRLNGPSVPTESTVVIPRMGSGWAGDEDGRWS